MKLSRRTLPYACCVLLSLATAVAAASPRQNIVFILVDDLGYMDIGANNADSFYETPVVDSLAKRGMRFTAGYAACPVCSPTRASIMSGKWPARVGITNFIAGERAGKLLSAPFKHELALEEVTIAETLRDAGYANFFAGKWHLGKAEYSPRAQGFDAGLIGDKQFYYPPDEGPVPDKNDDPKSTDKIAEAAVRFIETHRERPFFAYLPFTAVHVPVRARQDLLDKYERKATAAPVVVWGREGGRKMRIVQNNAGYAAMVEQLDLAIGRVLAAIERTGLAERTIIVFTSDNGGLSIAEGHPTSNQPLRGGKGWLYEGGVRVPWIVVAPGVTRPGSICDAPVVSNDFYPTLLELVGLDANPHQHCDGVSFAPLLKGAVRERGPIFWHYPHNSNQGGGPGGAVRDGDWKFIAWYEDNRFELFNLRDDPGEQSNLASQYPEKVQALGAKLDSWRHEVGAIMPLPNPEWNSVRR